MPYDRPLRRDWIAWLTLVALIAGYQAVATDYGGIASALSTRFNRTAFFIDLAVASTIQFLLFGVLPGSIRNRIRRLKTPEAIEQRAARTRLKNAQRAERKAAQLAHHEAEWAKIEADAQAARKTREAHMASRSAR